MDQNTQVPLHHQHVSICTPSPPCLQRSQCKQPPTRPVPSPVSLARAVLAECEHCSYTSVLNTDVNANRFWQHPAPPWTHCRGGRKTNLRGGDWLGWEVWVGGAQNERLVTRWWWWWWWWRVHSLYNSTICLWEEGSATSPLRTHPRSQSFGVVRVFETRLQKGAENCNFPKFSRNIPWGAKLGNF